MNQLWDLKEILMSDTSISQNFRIGASLLINIYISQNFHIGASLIESIWDYQMDFEGDSMLHGEPVECF